MKRLTVQLTKFETEEGIQVYLMFSLSGEETVILTTVQLEQQLETNG
jgi:hypothetical protein